jgi:GT2 family glycosyltransferase
MTRQRVVITVLIATYNRAAHLEQCLQSLAVQRFEPGDEVLIVDNASTDHTRAVVQKASGWFPVALRYFHESSPGKSNALVLGVAHAAGDVLALTDDDVLVAADWIEAVREGMRDASIALTGGRVEPRWETSPPRWLQLQDRRGYSVLAAPLALLDYGAERDVLDERSALGANMAVRRAALDEIGGFPASLGKLRGTLLSGEDRYVCERLRDAGHRCVYSPAMVVRHWVPKARTRLWYFARWFFWSGITNSALDGAERTPGLRTLLGVPVYLLKRLAAGSVAAVAAAVTGRFATAVEHGVAVAFAAGYIAHRWGVLASGVTLQTHASAQQP